MPNGSDRITSHPLQELQPTKTIDDPEIKAWLALGTKTKKKGGGKKKKGTLEHDWLWLDRKQEMNYLCFMSNYQLILIGIASALPGKKEDKAEESTEAEPMDATTNGADGAASQE